MVTPGYFRTLGIDLRGREFDDNDIWSSERVIILSKSVASRLFPDIEPIGRIVHLATVLLDEEAFGALLESGDEMRVRRVPNLDAYIVSNDTRLTVVGVANDVRMSGNDDTDAGTGIYVPFAQAIGEGFGGYLRRSRAVAKYPSLANRLGQYIQGRVALDKYVIRSSGDLAPILEVARQRLESDARLFDVSTARLGDLASASIRGAGSDHMLGLAVVFGTMALLLAAVGIYGVMAHTVAERTSEIGIRMTLGATPQSILGMVLRRGLLLAGVGLAVGALGAWIASRTLTTLLFGVSADWIAFVAGSLVTLLVAFAATLGPASRAARVDPATAMRHS